MYLPVVRICLVSLVFLSNAIVNAQDNTKKMAEYVIKTEDNMKLSQAGYIDIGDGCEAYLTAKIFFRPAGDNLKIKIDNSGYYFFQYLPTKKSLNIVLKARVIEPFFIRLKALLIAPQPEKIFFSTRNAKVKIFLPFQPEALDKQLVELEQKYFMDPLLELIDEFVQDISDGKINSVYISQSETKAQYGEN